jgi:hypothetical protein
MRWRYSATAAALAVIIAAAAGAILVHVLLGLFELKLAIAETSTEDRQAATALIGLFSAQHPRVRIRTVLAPDRLFSLAVSGMMPPLVFSSPSRRRSSTRSCRGRRAIGIEAPV